MVEQIHNCSSKRVLREKSPNSIRAPVAEVASLALQPAPGGTLQKKVRAEVGQARAPLCWLQPSPRSIQQDHRCSGHGLTWKASCQPWPGAHSASCSPRGFAARGWAVPEVCGSRQSPPLGTHRTMTASPPFPNRLWNSLKALAVLKCTQATLK